MTVRPAHHSASDTPHIGLSLSGGGFRATLFHLGVVRTLFDAGMLKYVTTIASVSGGSVLAAHLVSNWERYNGSPQEFDDAASELIDFIRSDVRGHLLCLTPFLTTSRMILMPLKWIGGLPGLGAVRNTANSWMDRLTTTDEFKRRLRRLYGKAALSEALGAPVGPTHAQPGSGPPTRPLLNILATNLTCHSMASFSHQGFMFSIHRQDEHIPVCADTISLARAVAASAAFPVFFPAVILRHHRYRWPWQQVGTHQQYLSDAGVYDNLGTSWFEASPHLHRVTHMIVSDATGKVDWDITTRMGFAFGTAFRTMDIVLRRTRDLMAAHVEQAHTTTAHSPPSLLVSIEDRVPDHAYVSSDAQPHLSAIRTDLDRFSEAEISMLFLHGYQVARKMLGEWSGGVLGERFATLPPDPPKTVPPLTIPPNQQVKLATKGARRRWWVVTARRPMSWVLPLLVLMLAATIGWAIVQTMGEHERRWHGHGIHQQIALSRELSAQPVLAQHSLTEQYSATAESVNKSVKILEDTKIYDFSRWRPVAVLDDSPVDFSTDSPVTLVRIIVIKKVGQAKYVRLTFGTSGKDVFLEAPKGLSCVVEQSEDTDETGRRFKRRDLRVDVSHLNPGERIEVVIKATLWNSFQEQDMTSVLIPSAGDRERISVVLVWGDRNRPSELTRYRGELESYGIRGDSADSIGMWLRRPGFGYDAWIIDRPSEQTEYRVEWTFPR